MKKLSISIGLVILSLSMAGCEALSSLPFFGGGSGEEGEVSVAPATTAPTTTPANPSGTETSTDPDANAGENPEFEDPVVERTDTELPAPEGLLPVTDTDDAIKIIEQNQGRQNPFATIPVQVPESASAEANAPKLPIFPFPTIPPLVRPIPIPQAPSDIPSPEFDPSGLPGLPEPTIAEGLTVTGVVNLGETIQAIVQDSEGKSRYVRPGEYLAGGQVLVKRIEMNRGPQPVVVFEELGIEVIRAVGEPPADSNA